MPDERIQAWVIDPIRFVREQFGVEPDLWQRDVLMAISRHQRVAMKACKGPGKTCVMAWIVWWFLCTRTDPKVVCTSISGENLRDNLWTELSKWQKKSPLCTGWFTWSAERITHNGSPESWWAVARRWPKQGNTEQQANTLAGIHEDHVLFVLDESGGIPDGVMAAAEGALSSGGDTRLLQAGNPTHLEGPLYRACTAERHLWHVTEITGDPDDPKRSPRVSKQWAREQIQKHGKDDPWVLVNVFGKFPPSSLNQLLGPDDVEKAINRVLPHGAIAGMARTIGIDVARFGDDENAWARRQGLLCHEIETTRNMDTLEIAGRTIFHINEWRADGVFFDGTGGWAAGSVDQLRQARYRAHEINFSGKAADQRYYNKRAEMWFLMAQWVKREGKLPNDPQLKRELTAPTYTFKDGRLMIEPKEDIKARLGFSPNRADALGLTFALPVVPKPQDHFGNPQGLPGVRMEPGERKYDPLASVRGMIPNSR